MKRVKMNYCKSATAKLSKTCLVLMVKSTLMPKTAFISFIINTMNKLSLFLL